MWLDHVRAVVAHLRGSATRIEHLDPHPETPQLHRKSGPPGAGHRADDVALFEAVAHAVADVDEILVVGPGMAKRSFMRHVASHHPDLERRVVAVETCDHPTDAQLVAAARRSFRRVDQLLGDP